jgi:hypothetical protein
MESDSGYAQGNGFRQWPGLGYGIQIVAMPGGKNSDNTLKPKVMYSDNCQAQDNRFQRVVRPR